MSTLFSTEQRTQAEAIAELVLCNPFQPRRVELERRVLGDRFTAGGEVWAMEPARLPENPNVARIRERAEALVAAARPQLEGDGPVPAADLDCYEAVATYALYERVEEDLFAAILDDPRGRGQPTPLACWPRFQAAARELLGPVRRRRPVADDAFLIALFWQVRRAFHLVFTEIFGASPPAARLRAHAWQSVFTHDARRYRRGLYRRMHEIPTLVTGPSGTGKDLVARAVGGSGFIPFDPGSGVFVEDFRECFLPLNLSTLSPTVIESELFGHRKGAFTGAIADRAGYLEGRTACHAVFLDEIGELDPAIQVKLLQVLQSREFRRIGETVSRRFEGRIVAATNRDLDHEVEAGRFRVDLYYRLCADRIETPSLAELARSDPQELTRLVRLLARRLVEDDEAEEVADQVTAWIDDELGPDYPWPGNVRELEQCVRNVIVRGTYRPLRTRGAAAEDPRERVSAAMLGGELTADELLDRYVTMVYHRTGGFVPAARTLGLDRRTVKRRVMAELLDELDRTAD